MHDISTTIDKFLFIFQNEWKISHHIEQSSSVTFVSLFKLYNSRKDMYLYLLAQNVGYVPCKETLSIARSTASALDSSASNANTRS